MNEDKPDEKKPNNRDAEIHAMSRIIKIMDALDTDQRRRVGAWAADRYDPDNL